MGWGLFTVVVVVGAVLLLLDTVRRLEQIRDEIAHYRDCTRLWSLLTVLGLVMLLVLVQPFVWPPSDAQVRSALAHWIGMGIASFLPMLVTVVAARNAIAFHAAAKRRRRALLAGDVVSGVVVERVRKPLGRDVVAAVIEVPLPAVRRDEIRRLRFVEICPLDRWSHLEPGASVAMKVVPEDPGSYALLLFASADGAAA